MTPSRIESDPPPAAETPLDAARTIPEHGLSRLLAALGFAVLALVVYSSALRAGFVWDDDSYVTENANLADAAGLERIWLEPRSSPQYYPLVFTGFWLERRLYGLEPLGYHVVNVLLHATAALLLWRLLHRLRLCGALFAALLFLVHPMHVESVAWVTERKNVLSMCLVLASALAWLRFRPPEASDHEASGSAGLRWWWAALLLFLAALLCKTVTAALPFALLVVAWWKRGRLTRADLLPLLPFLLIAIPLGWHTSLLEREHVGAHGLEWQFSHLERFLIAGRVFWFYLGKLLWPHPLIFFYPRWDVDTGDPAQLLYPVLVIVLLALLWIFVRKIGRGPLAAALVFGLGIGPASGFFDVYPMRYSFVADHFAYLGSLGVLAAVAWGLTRAARRTLPPAAIAPLAGALLGVLGWMSWRQAHTFQDAETLWVATIERNPTSWAALSGLGHLYLRDGREEEGRELLRRAAAASPYPSEAYQDVAYLRFEEGDVEGALELYEPLLAARPAVAEKVCYTALHFFDAGRRDDGLQLLQAVVDVVPDDSFARLVYGGCLGRVGRLREARAQYEAVLAKEPFSPEAHYSLAGILAHEGQSREAIRHYEQALAGRPGWPEAQSALAALRARR